MSERCGGTGWITEPQHDIDCDPQNGCGAGCPIPAQVECPGCADCKPCERCGGTGLHKSVPYDAQCNWCHGTGREP
jgi:hypothetical protein